MKLRTTMVIALVALFSIAAFGADISGKWTSERPGRDGATQTTTYMLKQDGTKLTGTVDGGRGGAIEISEGTVNGDDVSFKVVREMQGNKFVTKYTGKVAGSEIKMKTEREGGQGGGGGKGGPAEITLKKATS